MLTYGVRGEITIITNNEMMSIAFRFVFFVLIQGLVMHQVSNELAGFRYIHLIIYPLFVCLLPLKMNTIQGMLLAFTMGLLIDFFYSSVGVHAAALVLTAYLKPFVVYQMQIQQTTLGRRGIRIIGIEMPIFIRMMVVLTLVHNFTYFLLLAFSFSNFFHTLLLTFFSTIASLLLMLMYLLVFQPNQ